VFAQALSEIVRRLEDAKARRLLDQYALIGGFAVSAWGVPRATHDVDFALALGTADAASLARHLHAEFHAGKVDDPLRGVFRTNITVDQVSVPIQLILLPSAWNTIIFDRVECLSLLGATVPVVSWQALILLKLYAAGPQDLLDAQQILAVRQPAEHERQALASRASTLGLTEAWQMATER
jgi:predicted nucleotidyltransferase